MISQFYPKLTAMCLKVRFSQQGKTNKDKLNRTKINKHSRAACMSRIKNKGRR